MKHYGAILKQAEGYRFQWISGYVPYAWHGV